jgi:hypothetical protein
MRELDDVLEDLCSKRADLKYLVEQRDSMLKTMQSLAARDELAKNLQKSIDAAKAEVKATVAELVRWPPHKKEHFEKLGEFFGEHPYDKSVFIMTKYPDNPPKTPLDAQLKTVIETVSKAVRDSGYKPHLASDKIYHPELFRNIEVYMLGCSKAIAIVESKHTQELNPNVMMEWGWLRSTDRKVLYLVEKDFNRARADISGLINKEFDWNDPGPGIAAAVQEFLR